MYPQGPSNISPPSISTPEVQPVPTSIPAPDPTPIPTPAPTPLPVPKPTPVPVPEPTPIPESISIPTTSPDQSKEITGKAIIKLVKKVKKLEVALKKRRVVLSDSEDEDIEKDEAKGYMNPKDGTTTGDMDIIPQGLEAAQTLTETL
ncbi:hypothetical protein Tco_0192423, partial [Tanacetum coccineum]